MLQIYVQHYAHVNLTVLLEYIHLFANAGIIGGSDNSNSVYAKYYLAMHFIYALILEI